MTSPANIGYGDDVLLALGMTADEFRDEERIFIAVKLYEMSFRPVH